MTVRSDGVSPAELFAAALRHGNAELHRLIEAMDREVAPADATVLTGGWASMLSVQRSRSLVLPHLRVSTRSQETAYGAATFAEPSPGRFRVCHTSSDPQYTTRPDPHKESTP